MNVVEVIKETLISLLYNSSVNFTDLEVYEQQVIYWLSLVLGIIGFLTFIKVILKIFRFD